MSVWAMPEDSLPRVGGVQEVLHALADSVRLEMVRRLAETPGGALACNELYEGVSKSTATHHFKVLVEAGIIRRVIVAGARGHALRREDLELAMPGLMNSVVGALARHSREVSVKSPSDA